MTTYTYFVSSVDGSDGDTGADWTNAKASITGALAAAAAVPVVSGDLVIIKVDSAHAHNAGAAITYTPVAGVNYSIISVNRAGSDAWLAGASESVGSGTVAFTIAGAVNSSWFIFGLTINGSSGASNSNLINLLNTTSVQARLHLLSCTLDLKGAGTTSFILGLSANSGARQGFILAEDCTFITSGSRAGNMIQVNDIEVEMINPTFSSTGGTKPAALFTFANVADTPVLTVRDGDLSGYATSSGAYFAVGNLEGGHVLVKNCKLSATPSLVSGTWPGGPGDLTLRNVDSGDTITVFEFRNAYGTLTEDTSVYATGGAEFNGAGIGWQIVTTSACNEHNPFIAPFLSVWNTVTSAQTATVEIANNSATALKDTEVWLELSYPASASFPTYANDNDRSATPYVGASGSNQASSTNGWTGLGGTNTQQKCTVAFTAADVGRLEGRIAVAKASQTLFVDPLLKVA